ncbi:uncharacterized protein LOC142226686 [Haematobia irritans]|uniref:uncharacterized protein LOC142226686 n=1 Tax=Haematobia irritans TaxID=7368 RepID=UPI003F4F89AB
MNSDVGDMFTILSFMKLCKMYQKLKRSKPQNKSHVIAKNSYPKRIPLLSLQRQHPAKKIQLQPSAPPPKESSEEVIETYSVINENEEIVDYDECIEPKQCDATEQHIVYDENDQIITIEEEKPKIIIDNITSDGAYIDPNYQYEISFEVNGEQRHVVLGNSAEPGEESKYECQEVDENGICYEICPAEQEIMVESTEEIQVTEIEEDQQEAFCYEVDAEEIEEEYEVAAEISAPPKKRRRRRRRGEPEEEVEPKEKKARTRSFKVRPENLDRHKEGFFGRVFLDVKKENEEQFVLLTRMKRPIFEKLLKLTFKAMSKRAQHIYPEERLSVTLLYLAHGTPFDIIAKYYKLGKTTIRNLVLETCEILYEILGPLYLGEPTSEDYLKIAKDFKNTWKLPNCVGVIDGKHINLKKPKRTLLEDYNLTSMTSLVLMASCDARHRFRSATVTVEPHQSTFAKGIMNNTLPLPPNGPLVEGSPLEFPYYFIGDTTFPLRANLMRPYDESTLDDKKLVFNYKLSHGQAILDNTFTMLTSMWRVLLTTFDLAPLNCESIIMACVVLHNFVMIHGEDRWHNSDGTINAELPHNVDENTEWITVEASKFQSNLESITKYGAETNGTGNELRDTLADHFFQEGADEGQTVIFEI